jgi:nicotinamidase-related amidase
MKDALVLVDVINDFRHEDGEALLVSFRARHGGLRTALDCSRGRIPVIYANDDGGRWSGDAPGLVRDAVTGGLGAELVERVAPRSADHFIFKPRYSAFDSTPLEILLRELQVERLLLAGTVTERCVAQTAIAARELGFKVTILTDACACVDPRLEEIALEYLDEVAGVCLGTIVTLASELDTSQPAPGARSRAAAG